MAFMMPVVKNDWDIYKSNRSRRSSECSNPQSCRSRKVSECSKSEGPSLSTSPGSDFIVGSPAHRSVPMAMSSSSRQYSRASSRASQSSLQSPSKSASSSPPKSGSQSSLNKFHNRLVDKLKRSLRGKDAAEGADPARTSS
ncbi:ADP-ribosylation factor-like protein 6-interacting protein 4 [Periplaneta americana]|uniref:ADP-ribosylation factor-like protein 6-interacting protein 4 n=1 Tax=Periplaneta americana TaxID=6978 RepID=UPI0037E89768